MKYQQMLGRRNRKGAATVYDRLFRYAEFLGFGELHIKIDQKTGLRAIIALHSTVPGPAIGGCRCLTYDTTDQALADALRLAQMMSYKAAAANLSHGGAKAVLMKHGNIKDRQSYFESFGKFVDEMDGRYITAVDSGTVAEDMDIVATRTKYVTCTSDKYHGDPSPTTAHGVVRGLLAAVKYKFGQDDLENIHIAIQGLGHVGKPFAHELYNLGAKLTVCDTHTEHTDIIRDECHAEVVAPEDIYSVECDVFAPCALGAILNLKNIKKLRCKIVAGAANNQLAHKHHGVALHERGILYTPDFFINSAGLIHVAVIYDNGDQAKAEQQIENIYETTMQLFQRAEKEQRAISQIAETIALEKLGKY